MGKSDNLVSLGGSEVHSLDEGESHLFDSIEDRLHGPSVEFGGIIGDFLVEHNHGHLIEILGPSLSLVIPLKQSKQIGQTFV